MPTGRGRVALVTGSSRGLGAVIARRLAHDGLAVAVSGPPGDGQAHEVSRSIRGGGAARAFLADVTDEQQAAGLIAAVTGRLGPAGVLVVSAAGPRPEAPVTEVAWADQLAPLGITVNTVAPGFIPVERHAGVPDEARNAYLAPVPAGRMGTPADIAHAASFPASGDAGFITGQRIVVDGGRSLGS